jgi:hypothetical protein
MALRMLFLLLIILPTSSYSEEELKVGDTFEKYVSFLKKLDINTPTLEERDLNNCFKGKGAVFICGPADDFDERKIKNFGSLIVTFNGRLDIVNPGEERHIVKISFYLRPKNKNIYSMFKDFEAFPLNFEKEIFNKLTSYQVRYYQISNEAFNLAKRLENLNVEKGEYAVKDIINLTKKNLKDVKFEIYTKGELEEKLTIEDNFNMQLVLDFLCLNEKVYFLIYSWSHRVNCRLTV